MKAHDMFVILISPILVAHLLGTKWWNICKKKFSSPLQKHQRNGKGEKNYKKGIAKLFALHANTETNKINTFKWRSLKGIQFMQNIKTINISRNAVCLIEKKITNKTFFDKKLK